MKPRTIEEWMRDKEASDTPVGRRSRALIPARYHRLTWDDYENDAVTKDGEPLKEILQFYAEDYAESRRPGSDKTTPMTEGIVVLGQPGWGKTMGMALLACDLVDAGAWVRWTSWADLTKRKKNLFTLARQAEENDDWSEHEKEEMRIRWIERDCDVLFLDDVGKEYRAASGWSDAELDQLLRSRTAAGKVTMITSNLMWREWRQYSDAMASFLREMGEVVLLTAGTDHRGDANPTSKRARRRAER